MPSPELDCITVKGFKSFASIEKLPLRAINVVIGPNGSGKSNFIGVFSFLNVIRQGKLRDYVAKAGGAEKILHFGSKTTSIIEIHVSFQNEVNQYKIRLGPASGDQLSPAGEVVCFWDKQRCPDKPYDEGLAPYGREAGISDPNCRRIADFVCGHLDSWRLYHFHDTSAGSPMKKTASLNDNRFLRPDGSNLAAFLYFLREKHQAAYGLIRGAVQRVAPFFDDFQLEPVQLKPDTILLEWRHKGSDAYFDASMISDGTLRFMALATLFLQPVECRPSVILVDEPELGLHPYAITMLAALIKQASTQTQVIIGTQSPLLLDHFRPEDVLVANRVERSTQLTRLETDKLAAWLEDYSLGQLWEKNEIGGRPAQE
ncbi:MAG: AAA family ATPase [Verrucomicrobia bacterium]|nr:AAA family ATPase [Verrucomicrobiota bacterium]